MTLRHSSLIHTLCIPGQTPGGNVEAAGQSRGSHSHRSRGAHLAWGQRWTRGTFDGQQSPAAATQSPGGKADCMVHFLTLLQVFPIPPLLFLLPRPFINDQYTCLTKLNVFRRSSSYQEVIIKVLTGHFTFGVSVPVTVQYRLAVTPSLLNSCNRT